MGKNYLNDVMSLRYSREDDLVIKKGELALLIEDYRDGKYCIEQYEARKTILEHVIEDLSRTLCV